MVRYFEVRLFLFLHSNFNKSIKALNHFIFKYLGIEIENNLRYWRFIANC